jgi:radical SAM superfamily enzyme YgiQ (UPF0313 family)
MHPTLYPREIMENCSYFDAVVTGEADRTFPLLLDYYSSNNVDNGGGGEQNLPPELDGIVLRIDNKIVVREKKGFIHNLDELPQPGYEYFDFRQYASNTATFFNPNNIKINDVEMQLLTSRSCPNQCYFCSMRLVMGNRFRIHSAQAVFNQIKYVYDRYGINYFDIRDDNFTFDRQRTLDICDLIVRNKLEIYMNFQNGLMIRTLDDEVMDSLCEAGGVRFNIAIESGYDYIRNTILKKNCSKEKIIAVAERLKSKGVQVNAFFIIGFPEETEESLKETVELMEMLNVDVILLSKLEPFPGTRLFEQCLRDNLFTDNIQVDQLWKGEHGAINSTPDGERLDQFLIKPYAIDMDKLLEYDEKMNRVIKKKMVAAVRSRLVRKAHA